jgi:nucleoside phosphorylase
MESRKAKRIWTGDVHRELYEIVRNEWDDILLALDGGEIWQFTPRDKNVETPYCDEVENVSIMRDSKTGQPSFIACMILSNPRRTLFGNVRKFPAPAALAAAASHTQREKVDVAILTVLPDEFNAVCGKLTDVESWPGTAEMPNLYAWRLAVIPRVGTQDSYRVALGMTGRAGTNESTAATLKTISQWHPRYIFFTGIAGALRAMKKGDVVIADAVFGYEYGKIKDNLFKPRPDWTTQTDGALFRGASAYAIREDWKRHIVERPPSGCETMAKPGGILSGDKVVDDPAADFFKQALAEYSKAEAVEMEGAGVGCAIRQAHDEGVRVGFMMIRGISDEPRVSAATRAGEARGTEERDRWKAYAADVAAAFTVGYIASGLPVPPEV